MTTTDDQGNEQPTGKKKLILKAYTVKDGKWDSAVVTYEYVFGNEVPVPESEELVYNAEPQTGVQGSPFYTLTAAEGSGVTIDDEGNATATDAGTYTVTAKIKDGFRWTTGDGDDTATTTDDQQISFTISPVMISDAAKISAKGTFRTLNDLKKALSVVPTGELKPEEGRDYEISYGKVKGGKVTVTVTGKGNYAGTISGTFIIDPDKKVYTITLDLNGGELDGVTGTITEQYEEGTVITMPKPEKEGCTFLYWKGSEYHAGDRYKVTEDHTFAAQWEKSTEKGDHGDGESGSTDTRGQSEKSGSARTGDSVRILEWTALFLASLLALLIIVLRKNKDRI